MIPPVGNVASIFFWCLCMNTNSSVVESRDGEVTIVSLGADLKRIDESNVRELAAQLSEIVQKTSPKLIVLDLSPTDFFGSSFIEILFRLWKTLRKEPSSRFALCGLQPYCREVLTITRLDSLWEIYDSATAAAKALNDESTRRV